MYIRAGGSKQTLVWQIYYLFINVVLWHSLHSIELTHSLPCSFNNTCGSAEMLTIKTTQLYTYQTTALHFTSQHRISTLSSLLVQQYLWQCRDVNYRNHSTIHTKRRLCHRAPVVGRNYWSSSCRFCSTFSLSTCMYIREKLLVWQLPDLLDLFRWPCTCMVPM